MQIAPSILTADFCELGKVMDEVISEGINWIHLDVMDGNWVVNKTITFGPALIKSIRQRVGPEVFVDCHLMVTNAEDNWEQYVDAAGVVLNPSTPSSAVLPYLSELDLVLVMSVVPGKGGQSFMPEMELKIREFRTAIDSQILVGGRSTKLMIDGGIKYHNAALVKSWGIDVAVVGSGLINNNATIKENLIKINSMLSD